MKFIKREVDSELINFYLKKKLALGLLFLITSFFFFPKNSFLLKKSLIEKSGEIEYIKKVYSNIDSKLKGTSKKTIDINIKFKNDTKIYFLNTDKHVKDFLKFSKIANQLNESKKATVWIKKNSINKSRLNIYQITSDYGKILFSLHESRFKSFFSFFILFALGILGILSFLFSKYTIA